MRNQADVNAPRTAFREHARSNGARIQLHDFMDAPETRPPRHWFLPTKETRIMADEVARTSGLFLPYPVIGFLLTLTMALVAGLVGLYSQMATMQTTMILRDATYQQQVKELKEKVDLQGMYITDLREKVIRQEIPKKKGG